MMQFDSMTMVRRWTKMEVMKRRIFIPRKRTTPVPCRIEDLDQRARIPLESVLTKILARFYHERRSLMDECT